MTQRTRATYGAVLASVAAAAACTNVMGGRALDGDATDEAQPVITDAHPIDPTEGLVGAVDVSVWSSLLTDSDVDCFWQRGVRHVIAGTQFLEVTRQQLDIAMRGGMSVDLYVYLFWDESITAQVEEALSLTNEYPAVGRIWLDIEEPADGTTAAPQRGSDGVARSPDDLEALLREGLDACGDFPCGFYTGRGWWQTWFEDREVFAHVPLWYARWDGRATLSTWPNDSFGGWVRPAMKQFAEAHVCRISVDVNVLDPAFVETPAQVVLERGAPPDDGTPPDAPRALHPDGGATITTDWVRPTAPIQRDATAWQIDMERWNGREWKQYLLLELPRSSRTVSPTLDDVAFRWRLRAKNTHGYGSWSSWAWFQFGTPQHVPTQAQVDFDGASPPTEAPTTAPVDGDPPPEPAAPPIVDGAPTPTAPADGSMQSGPGVTLSATAVTDASAYEFDITTERDGASSPYTTYRTTAAQKTFYPVTHDVTYAWRVRAVVDGAAGPWSTTMRFGFP